LVGVLALLCGALWTMEEYTEHRAELRLAETNRFLDQFRSGPVAAAWGRLRTAWRAEQGRQDALFERLPSLTGRERARVLHEHQMFVLETIDEYRLHDEIEAVHQFVNRLAICVRMGSCDADVAAAQLGKALWTFLDQHRPYFAFEYSTTTSRRSRRGRPGQRIPARRVGDRSALARLRAQGRAGGGWFRCQWRAISARVVIHTRSWLQA
jgi:hypothetical protein